LLREVHEVPSSNASSRRHQTSEAVQLPILASAVHLDGCA
jgi:hypothetical protein